MAFPCFVLGRGSSSQTFIGVHQIGGGADVDTVVHATQNLVSGYYKWESDAIGIELYKVLLNLMLHGPFLASFDVSAAHSTTWDHRERKTSGFGRETPGDRFFFFF